MSIQKSATHKTIYEPLSIGIEEENETQTSQSVGLILSAFGGE